MQSCQTYPYFVFVYETLIRSTAVHRKLLSHFRSGSAWFEWFLQFRSNDLCENPFSLNVISIVQQQFVRDHAYLSKINSNWAVKWFGEGDTLSLFIMRLETFSIFSMAHLFARFLNRHQNPRSYFQKIISVSETPSNSLHSGIISSRNCIA